MAGRMAGERFGLGALMRGTRTGMVRVEGLLEEGPGRRAGLKEGDLIVEVEGRRTRTLDELGEVLSEVGQKGQIVMMVKKDDGCLEEVVVLKDHGLPLPRMDKSSRRSMERGKRPALGSATPVLPTSGEKATKVVVVCRRDNVEQLKEEVSPSAWVDQNHQLDLTPRVRGSGEECSSVGKSVKERRALQNLSNLPPSSARAKMRRSAEKKEERKFRLEKNFTESSNENFVCLVDKAKPEEVEPSVQQVIQVQPVREKARDDEHKDNYEEISQEIHQMQHLLSQSSQAIADMKHGLTTPAIANEGGKDLCPDDFDMLCKAVEKYKLLLAETEGSYRETAEQLEKTRGALEETTVKIAGREEELEGVKQELKEEKERVRAGEEGMERLRKEQEEEIFKLRREMKEEVEELEREKEQLAEKLRREREEEFRLLRSRHEEEKEGLKREKEGEMKLLAREKEQATEKLRSREEEMNILRMEKEQEEEKLRRKEEEMNMLRRDREEALQAREGAVQELEQIKAELGHVEEALEAKEQELMEMFTSKVQMKEEVEDMRKKMEEEVMRRDEEVRAKEQELDELRRIKNQNQEQLDLLKLEIEDLQRKEKEQEARAEATKQAIEDGAEEIRGQGRRDGSSRSLEKEVKRLRAVLEANSLAAARREEVISTLKYENKVLHEQMTKIATEKDDVALPAHPHPRTPPPPSPSPLSSSPFPPPQAQVAPPTPDELLLLRRQLRSLEKDLADSRKHAADLIRAISSQTQDGEQQAKNEGEEEAAKQKLLRLSRVAELAVEAAAKRDEQLKEERRKVEELEKKCRRLEETVREEGKEREIYLPVEKRREVMVVAGTARVCEEKQKQEVENRKEGSYEHVKRDFEWFV